MIELSHAKVSCAMCVPKMYMPSRHLNEQNTTNKLSITRIVQQYHPIPKYFTKQATMCRKGACETWTERPVRF